MDKWGVLTAGACLSVAGAAMGAAGNQDTELQEIVVLGERFESRLAAGTATKDGALLIETPRSISVIDAEQIAAQQLRNIDQVLRYAPGVSTEFRGMDNSRTDIAMRGFNWSGFVYTDGMRSGVSGYGEYDPEAYGLERLEVLLGPASTLYGATSPGGLVNIVTKRPTRERFLETGIEAGSHEQLAARMDAGGALDGEGRWRGRFTALRRAGESQIRAVDERRTYVAPALEWRPGEATSLTLLANYQDDYAPWAIFLPAQGTVFDNPNGRIPTSTEAGEAGFRDHFERDFLNIGYLFSHRFGNGVELRQSLRHSAYDFEARSVSGGELLEDLRHVARYPWMGTEDGQALVTDSSLLARFDAAGARHTLLVGVDYRNSDTSAEYGYTYDPAWDFDLFDPVYGTVEFPQDIEPYVQNDEKLSQAGFYLQDQLRLGNWALLLGGRHDRAKIRTEDHLAATTLRQTSTAFTWQAGVVHLFGNGLAPYANFAQSFEPQSGTDALGEQFEPTTGTQYEVGLKYQPAGRHLLATVSLFHVRQRNVLTTDPEDNNFYTQTGAVRSRGVELQLRTTLASGLEVVGNYGYADARVTESNDGNVGFRQAQVPDHSGSLWLDFRPATGSLRGLNLAAGVRHQGTSIDYANEIRVPAVTLVDARIGYRFGGTLDGLDISLNASNLLDKTYVSSCEGAYWCMYGPRRVMTATATYRIGAAAPARARLR